MNNPSLSDQATTPDQAVVAPEETQPHTPTNVSGSAMLDAHVETGGAQPEGDPIAAPIATNFSAAGAAGDAKTATASVTSEPLSAGQEQSEAGQVHLRSNPDVANDQMQGTLPNTDPIGMPIDPDTNHQE
jgi:hypothetical protein